MSDDTRALLRELLAEVLSENGNGRHVAPAGGPAAPVGSGGPIGSGGPLPVPAPPTAAVLRPSTWGHPATPGEVIGDGAAPTPTPARGAEQVTLTSDAELARFVKALAARFADPREREAAASGALRFTMGGGGAGTMRIESGAVTEKTVREAAANGARLVLAPRAVMTPLARERARALKVEVERERRC